MKIVEFRSMLGYHVYMRNKTAFQLRLLRKKACLSLSQVSELTDTPQRTWEQWEGTPGTISSRRPPGIAFRFLEFYILLQEKEGVDLDQFFMQQLEDKMMEDEIELPEDD